MELKEVFEPIVNFLKNFQRKDKEAISKEKAKERLQLVLMQDRASVSPDFFEMMKKEIIEVIKKYIEIDEETLEVQLTRGFEGEDGAGPALYANIPIKNIKPVARKFDNKEKEEAIEDPQEVANTIIEEIKTVSEEKLNNKNKKKDKHKNKQNDAKENVDTIKEETKVEEQVEEIKEEVIEETEAENIDKAEDNSEETKEENANFKAKLTGVKEGVANTFSKVKSSAKDRFKKIRSKAKN